MLLNVLRSVTEYTYVNQTWAYENDSRWAFVVGFGDIPESVLPSRVPDLHFDLGCVHCQGFYLEIDPDSWGVGGPVEVVSVPEQDVGLSDCGVADDDHFDEVVVALVLRSWHNI